MPFSGRSVPLLKTACCGSIWQNRCRLFCQIGVLGSPLTVDISSEAPEEAAKEIIVESPFTFEQEAKQGTYLWLSAYPIPKDEENLENLQLPKTVEVKIFIDDKLHKSNSGENYAMVQHIFGQENYQ